VISFKLNGKNVSLPSSAPVNLSNIKFSWSTLDTLAKKNVTISKAGKDSTTKIKQTGKESPPVKSNAKGKSLSGTNDKPKSTPKKPR
jgi:hypothetical protein